MILSSLNHGVARIALNRPDKRNALSPELVAALRDAVREAAGRAEVRVLMLAGEGQDFCSGADLAALQKIAGAGVMENLADAELLGGLYLDLRRCPKPVVAAVHGRALAGGCGLATACDLIVAAESAQFGYPEVNIGFVPAMVMAILRRNVSEKRAFELITLGAPISAREALESGLVNRVFPDSDFAAQAMAFAESLAAKPANAVALCKRLLYQMDGMTYATAIEAGVEMNAIARQTSDCKEGIARFLKK
jgi:methylglutaconyl-CoA hydratase